MCNKIIKPFVPCRKCQGKEGPEPGYYYSTYNGYQVIIECSCHSKWRQDSELSFQLSKSNINPDFTFNDYKGTKSIQDLNALKSIANNPEKYSKHTMVYVFGPNATQKTSMCQALGKELVLKDYTVQYTTMNEIVNALVKSFDDPNQEKKDYFINKCLSCDFLIIDESFDKKKVTLYNSGFQIPYLDNFIRSRFEIGKKSIIFVSNVKAEAIDEEGFGPSLQSLIVRNTRQSTLIFNDVWIENANEINRLGLFGK